ncbi:MAG: ribonuclease E/G [Bacteroidales bacterium]|nr:ribonuclease E/G [Clostridium sp.]MCM1204694.1 ribonuclease E/G [Bacteroidales bacterium]
MNQAVITQLYNTFFLLIYEDGELAECHPVMKQDAVRIGSIYIGRVEKVVKNIQSAFIRLEDGHTGYLPLDDKPALILNRTLPKGLPSLAENDLVLVQVEQEPQKMKQARVTGNISLSGRYVALDLQSGLMGVSRKIKDAERVKELRELIEPRQQAGSYGCILRTACEQADDRLILSEYESLLSEMEAMLNRAGYEKRSGCIRKGKPEYLAILEEYGINRINEVKTDIPEVKEVLKAADLAVITVEDSDYPLAKRVSLETVIERLQNKKVWLKSGGFLMIEPTEAMVVIDVNSGKSVGKKKKENHILKINLEAAKEITRQLRLRNLSGIIMVDFINMEEESSKLQIVKCLKEGLKKDKVPGYFVEITKLDVFELTRKKQRRPFHDFPLQKP